MVFFLCLVFLMLLRLFIAALWSPAGRAKRSALLAFWLLLVMFIVHVFLLLSRVVSLVYWCGT